jgi:hypothetical protein
MQQFYSGIAGETYSAGIRFVIRREKDTQRTVSDFFAVGALGRDVAEFRLDIDLRSNAVPRGQSWCRDPPEKKNKKIHTKKKKKYVIMLI